MTDDTDPENVSSYRLAFEDLEFLARPEVRSYRLALEYVKPQLVQRDMQIDSTVVVFGSARIPSPEASRRQLAEAEEALRKDPEDAGAKHALERARRLEPLVPYYEEARRFAALAERYQRPGDPYHFVVTTGGGPGIMEAANRGAAEAGLKTMAFNIEIPSEQQPNPYITPELCFDFHYFAIRKMHFLLRARALVAFPGGFGTMDELFESLTLIQTGKIEPMPIVLFGRDWWDRFMDLEALVEAATISPEDPDLICWANTAEEAWESIETFYRFTNAT
jgi:uncharacterized protein (TIGR00730 family)